MPPTRTGSALPCPSYSPEYQKKYKDKKAVVEEEKRAAAPAKTTAYHFYVPSYSPSQIPPNETGYRGPPSPAFSLPSSLQARRRYSSTSVKPQYSPMVPLPPASSAASLASPRGRLSRGASVFTQPQLPQRMMLGMKRYCSPASPPPPH
jgi:hypothetical protein